MRACMSAERLGALLEATPLVDAERTEVPLPREVATGTTTWVVNLPAGDPLPCWRELRDALAPCGLYPLVVSHDPPGAPPGGWLETDLFWVERAARGVEAPDAIIRASRKMTFEDALGHFAHDMGWEATHWNEVLEQQLEHTRQRCGGLPPAARLAHVPVGDVHALECALMGWEEAVSPCEAPEESRSLDWFEPDTPTGAVLLPITRPCEAFAYVPFFGAWGAGGHAALTRIFCSWEARFGAQPVVNWWGTMCALVASRPPVTWEEAFRLASEQVRVAPCTILLPGDFVRDVARHVWHGTRWFLHERP